MGAKKAAMEARFAEEARRMQQEEASLAKLEQELKTGFNKKEQSRIKELRATIEASSREITALERETNTRRDAMIRATDAYVDAEERLTQGRAARKKLEEEMLELILDTG